MLIVNLVRYILGYINFRAFGGLSDRFLNLCTRDGIPLWNIKNIKGNITASTTINGYLAIRKAAKKSGMQVTVVERKGIVFTVKRNKTRIGLLIGAIIFVSIIYTLSQFVWSVSLVGNVDLQEDYLLSAFERYGVKVGATISSIDNDDIAQRVVNEITELSWAAINRKGNVVVIEVREKTPAPEKYDNSVPTNLIADENGVILTIDVLYGNEEIKPGSAVSKGDLLISGVITYADGREKLVHADGYVKALVNRKANFNGNDFSVHNLISEKSRKKLFIFGVEIPLGSQIGDGLYCKHKSFMKSEKILLPLGIITEYNAEFSSDNISLNEATKDKLALWDNAFYVKELLDFSVVKNSSICVQESESGNEFAFSADCEQEIGVLQEIYVKNDDDNI
jgi:similar to stage IV sporulation protein